MAEFAMDIIRLLAHLLNGAIFVIQLGSRFLKILSPRVWGSAERIDSGSYNESHSVHLAFDAHGNALSVSNEYYTVWARHFTPHTGWGKPELIDHTHTTNSTDEAVRGRMYDPKVTFDTQGNAIAVWDRDKGYDDVLGFMHESWSNCYTHGVGWGEAERFEHTPGDSRPVKFARDTQGNTLAVWTHFTDNCSTLWAKRHTDKTGWGDAAPITGIGGDATILQLAFDANGNALVLWRTEKGDKNTSGLYIVHAIYYSATAGWGETKIISKVFNSYHMDTLKFAFDSRGNVIVVYSFVDSTDSEKQIHIWAKRYDISKGWEKALKIDPGVVTRYSNLVSESVEPKIAFDFRDTAIVVWAQLKENAQGGIWTNRYTPDKGWGKASPITRTDRDQSNHQLAADSSGNAMVVWQQKNGVAASYYTVDAGWGAPEHLYAYSDEGYRSFDPKIVFDADGNAIAIWWHRVFLYATIWSMQFTPGKGWGKLTQVKRDYTCKANYPFITIDPRSIAHVVWSQRDSDSSHVHYWTSHLLHIAS